MPARRSSRWATAKAAAETTENLMPPIVDSHIHMYAPEVVADPRARGAQPSPERVWSLLTDIPRWPEWNPDVKSVALEGEHGAAGVRLEVPRHLAHVAAAREVLLGPDHRVAARALLQEREAVVALVALQGHDPPPLFRRQHGNPRPIRPRRLQRNERALVRSGRLVLRHDHAPVRVFFQHLRKRSGPAFLTDQHRPGPGRDATPDPVPIGNGPTR